MLLSLNLKNFVIVDKLALEFGHGLSVFTGETGAGKSIVMDALGLLLGDRADAALVRHGEDKADLLAEFDLSDRPQAQAWLAENELAGDDAQHAIIRRTLDSQGKSRAFINGTPATLAQLKGLGEMLVDIHGQHAHQQLLRPENQRDLLDHFAGASTQASKVAQQWAHWRTLQEELAAAQRDASTFEAERERLSFQIEEVSGLSLTDNEWPELQAEHKRLQHAASLIDGVQVALTTLADGDENCQNWLGSTAHKLQALGDYDEQLLPSLQLLEGVEAQLAEAVSELRRYADHLELDPTRLEEVESRLDAIWRMARKYRTEPEQLPILLQGWQDRLEALGGSEGLARLQQAEKAAGEVWQKEAAALSKLRQQHAGKLAQAVTQEMKPLALADSRFEIALEAAAPGPHGAESVDFRVAHANTPARPMGKIVSGGELSRISLAIQVIVSELSGVGTLVFDEVDVGIGGRVAEIVGRMLADLAQQRQVLCITHLPQVAACGQHHYQVSKARAGAGMISQVHELDNNARVEEIARMLGGVEITETTRRHAAELLGHA
ncbi:DNA repair protein RecN [Amantichitinum ursilacus]|uniref:DNA repair protein RecN n=1 Tax=Amantichitinum ursilacus TaxID=857265 RepID=A0A0N0XKW9_9NEIS|nr:DNA repair protein RecN [Amantichitinum ursilacus]KPC55143.1 DNA repair protein RecN [Amantichitinum ursilacus]